MNERIAKLYDRAIVIEDGGNYVCGELDPVKFAELIIKECGQIAYSEENDYGNKIRFMILEHFGVE